MTRECTAIHFLKEIISLHKYKKSRHPFRVPFLLGLLSLFLHPVDALDVEPGAYQAGDDIGGYADQKQDDAEP